MGWWFHFYHAIQLAAFDFFVIFFTACAQAWRPVRKSLHNFLSPSGSLWCLCPKAGSGNGYFPVTGLNDSF